MEADDKPRRNMRSIEVSEENGKRSVKINNNETEVDVDLDEDNAADEEFPIDDYEPDPNDIDYENDEDIDVDNVDGDTGADDDVDIEEDRNANIGGTGDATETEDDTGDGDTDIDLEGDEEPQDNEDDTGNADEEANTDTEGTENNPEDVKESIHKQALYRKFVRLHDAVDNYISKLEDMTGTDRESNHKYSEIIDQFQQLKDFLFDFMIIKFKSESHIRCEYFYQRAIAVVNLLLDDLDVLHKSLRKKQEDAEKSSKRQKRKANS